MPPMLDQINKWRYIPTVGYETAEKMHEHNHTHNTGGLLKHQVEHRNHTQEKTYCMMSFT